MQKKTQHIGLFFGSFNPVHQGHLMLASYLLQYSHLHKIWFVVSPQNPLKDKKQMLAEYHRYQLVLLATEDNPGFEVSKVEFDMPKPSYTIDTLTYLSEKYPEHEFSLICGTDVLASFHKWKNYEEIINQFKVLVYNRPGQYKHPYEKHPAFTFIDAPSFDISSRFIRAGIRAGKDMRYFLPDKVYQYIKEMHFYEK